MYQTQQQSQMDTMQHSSFNNMVMSNQTKSHSKQATNQSQQFGAIVSQQQHVSNNSKPKSGTQNSKQQKSSAIPTYNSFKNQKNNIQPTSLRQSTLMSPSSNQQSTKQQSTHRLMSSTGNRAQAAQQTQKQPSSKSIRGSQGKMVSYPNNEQQQDTAQNAATESQKQQLKLMQLQLQLQQQQQNIVNQQQMAKTNNNNGKVKSTSTSSNIDNANILINMPKKGSKKYRNESYHNFNIVHNFNPNNQQQIHKTAGSNLNGGNNNSNTTNSITVGSKQQQQQIVTQKQQYISSGSVSMNKTNPSLHGLLHSSQQNFNSTLKSASNSGAAHHQGPTQKVLQSNNYLSPHDNTRFECQTLDNENYRQANQFNIGSTFSQQNVMQSTVSQQAELTQSTGSQYQQMQVTKKQSQQPIGGNKNGLNYQNVQQKSSSIVSNPTNQQKVLGNTNFMYPVQQQSNHQYISQTTTTSPKQQYNHLIGNQQQQQPQGGAQNNLSQLNTRKRQSVISQQQQQQQNQVSDRFQNKPSSLQQSNSPVVHHLQQNAKIGAGNEPSFNQLAQSTLVQPNQQNMLIVSQQQQQQQYDIKTNNFLQSTHSNLGQPMQQTMTHSNKSIGLQQNNTQQSLVQSINQQSIPHNHLHLSPQVDNLQIQQIQQNTLGQQVSSMPTSTRHSMQVGQQVNASAATKTNSSGSHQFQGIYPKTHGLPTKVCNSPRLVINQTNSQQNAANQNIKDNLFMSQQQFAQSLRPTPGSKYSQNIAKGVAQTTKHSNQKKQIAQSVHQQNIGNSTLDSQKQQLTSFQLLHGVKNLNDVSQQQHQQQQIQSQQSVRQSAMVSQQQQQQQNQQQKSSGGGYSVSKKGSQLQATNTQLSGSMKQTTYSSQMQGQAQNSQSQQPGGAGSKGGSQNNRQAANISQNNGQSTNARHKQSYKQSYHQQSKQQQLSTMLHLKNSGVPSHVINQSLNNSKAVGAFTEPHSIKHSNRQSVNQSPKLMYNTNKNAQKQIQSVVNSQRGQKQTSEQHYSTKNQKLNGSNVSMSTNQQLYNSQHLVMNNASKHESQKPAAANPSKVTIKQNQQNNLINKMPTPGTKAQRIPSSKNKKSFTKNSLASINNSQIGSNDNSGFQNTDYNKVGVSQRKLSIGGASQHTQKGQQQNLRPNQLNQNQNSIITHSTHQNSQTYLIASQQSQHQNYDPKQNNYFSQQQSNNGLMHSSISTSPVAQSTKFKNASNLQSVQPQQKSIQAQMQNQQEQNLFKQFFTNKDQQVSNIKQSSMLKIAQSQAQSNETSLERNQPQLDSNFQKYLIKNQQSSSSNVIQTISQIPHKELTQEELEQLSPRSKEIYMIKTIITDSFRKFKKPPKTQQEFYKIGKLLGRGAFGKVNLGLHRLTRKVVAIKSINMEFMKDESSKKKIKNEVMILKQLRHPNNIKLLETFETPKHMLMVMELCPGGDLLNYVRKRRKLTEKYAKFVFKQIMEGIAYLHQNKIVHRDIKLDNILLDGHGNIKIADFGVSKRILSKEILFEQCGTPAYIAPEIVMECGYQGFPVDIWSAGVCLYAMLYGNVPFKTNQMGDLNQLIKECEIEYKDTCSVQAISLMKRMMDKDPKRRITAQDCLANPWFDDVDEQMDIFDEQELQLIRKEFTYVIQKSKLRENNREAEDLNTQFTEHSINSADNQLIKNSSSKSVILCPFNTQSGQTNADHILKQAEGLLEEKDFMIRFNIRVRELDRAYEKFNNQDFDNGVYHKYAYKNKLNNGGNSAAQQQEDESKEPTIEHDQKAQNQESKPQLESINNDQFGSNPNTQRKRVRQNADETYHNYYIKKNQKIIKDTVNLGFQEDYLLKCLDDNIINHCTTTYYLLCIDQNY